MLDDRRQPQLAYGFEHRETHFRRGELMRIFSLSGVATLLAFSCLPSIAGDLPVLGSIERKDSRLDSLLPADAKIEVLASGFEWSEGPAWVRDGGYLIFSDIPRNSIMKFKPGEGLSLFMKPAGFTGIADYGREAGTNGLAIDAKGRLVSCEHGDRRLSRMDFDGGKRTLADNYEGKRLNSPNDLTIKSNGDIYFTDPPYGLPRGWDDPRRELDFCGVYRYAADGKLTLLTKALARPNGLAFSPDEKTLYIAQSDPAKATIQAFAVKDDGSLAEPRLFFDATPWVKKTNPGLPDGMKVDKQGNLWATGPGGVHIFGPDGKHFGSLRTGEATANCAWGDDGSTLYLAADMYLCRIKTLTKGAGW
jgi:gluconolactonase